MKTIGRPDVPKEFLDRYYGPKSRPEDRKEFEEWVRAKRATLNRSPAFHGITEAARKAVEMYRKDEESIPSVWKEPKDMGQRFTVVHHDLRENAYIAGYKEVLDSQKIYDLKKGRTDERIQNIKEV